MRVERINMEKTQNNLVRPVSFTTIADRPNVHRYSLAAQSTNKISPQVRTLSFQFQSLFL